MNRQKKQFIVITVIMIICIGLYFGMNYYFSQKDDKEKQKQEASKITAFELKDYKAITGVSYIKDNSVAALVKNSDNQWSFSDDTSVDIDEDVVEKMLVKLVDVKASQKIEESDDISQYGFKKNNNGNLEATTNTIILIDNANNTYTLYVGNQNPYDTDMYYLMVQGDNNIYTVDGEIQELFSKSIDDLKVQETTTSE